MFPSSCSSVKVSSVSGVALAREERLLRFDADPCGAHGKENSLGKVRGYVEPERRRGAGKSAAAPPSSAATAEIPEVAPWPPSAVASSSGLSPPKKASSWQAGSTGLWRWQNAIGAFPYSIAVFGQRKKDGNDSKDAEDSNDINDSKDSEDSNDSKEVLF